MVPQHEAILRLKTIKNDSNCVTGGASLGSCNRLSVLSLFVVGLMKVMIEVAHTL